MNEFVYKQTIVYPAKHYSLKQREFEKTATHRSNLGWFITVMAGALFILPRVNSYSCQSGFELCFFSQVKRIREWEVAGPDDAEGCCPQEAG